MMTAEVPVVKVRDVARLSPGLYRLKREKTVQGIRYARFIRVREPYPNGSVGDWITRDLSYTRRDGMLVIIDWQSVDVAGLRL